MNRNEKKKSLRRESALDMINKRSSRTKNEATNLSVNVGPELALELFGKVYGGNPGSGVVPGASPMSEDERREITYNVIVATLKKNNLPESLADEWFLKWFGRSYK